MPSQKPPGASQPSEPPARLTPSIARLAELVKADGRSVKTITSAAGIEPTVLAEILRGRLANPSPVTIERILTALGKAPGDMETPRR